jgi:glycosyltransferase involved in cell wall biosynthesis
MRVPSSSQIKRFTSQPRFEENIILSGDGSWPKISIVIPSYNQGDFLEKTILSILNQNYPNFEIIIIDGGSNDNSVEIIRRYEKYVAYWTSEPDSGQSNALNKGLCLCTGDYIGWQNSDDVYTYGTFYELAECTFRNPHKLIFYSHKLIIDENDNVKKVRIYAAPSKLYACYRGMILANQAAFFNKKVVECIGLLDETLRFAMDREYFLRALLLLGKKSFLLAERTWGAMRHHPATKTSVTGRSVWKREQEIIKKKYGLDHGAKSLFGPFIAASVRLFQLIKYRKLGIYFVNKVFH